MNKLCEYLDFRGIKHHIFAKKIGTSNTTLHQILKRGRVPSLKTAIEIEKKTKGFVTVYDWCDSIEDVEDKKNKNDKTENAEKE